MRPKRRRLWVSTLLIATCFVTEAAPSLGPLSLAVAYADDRPGSALTCSGNLSVTGNLLFSEPGCGDESLSISLTSDITCSAAAPSIQSSNVAPSTLLGCVEKPLRRARVELWSRGIFEDVFLFATATDDLGSFSFCLNNQINNPVDLFVVILACADGTTDGDACGSLPGDPGPRPGLEQPERGLPRGLRIRRRLGDAGQLELTGPLQIDGPGRRHGLRLVDGDVGPPGPLLRRRRESAASTTSRSVPSRDVRVRGTVPALAGAVLVALESDCDRLRGQETRGGEGRWPVNLEESS